MRRILLAAAAAVFSTPAFSTSVLAQGFDPEPPAGRDISTEAGDVRRPAGGVAYPHLTGEIELQIQADKLVKAPAGTNRNANVFSDSEANFGLFLTRELSLQTTFHLDQVKDQQSGGFLRGQALFLEQAFVNYQTRGWAAYAGKFNPQFGMFWDRAPGVYGDAFSKEDYQLTEAIGGGGSVTFDTLSFGSHELGAGVWFKDNSPLSWSLINRPSFGAETTLRVGQSRRAYGGAGNTAGPRSWSASARGDQFAIAPNLAYNVDFSSLAPGVDGTARQQMLAAGLQYQLPMPKGWKLVPLAEYVRIWHLDGDPGGVSRDRTLVNAGLALSWQQWTLSGVMGWRNTDAPSDASADAVHDRLTTVSLGYEFDFGLELQAGWARTRLAGETTQSLGALATYKYRF
jgi:hypothetical protein